MGNGKLRSVYVHVPYCLGKCFYCGFFSVDVRNSTPERLLEAEIRELCEAKIDAPIKTLYVGGGSPSSLGGELLCGFLEKIVSIVGNANEFTVEVNPGQVDEKMLSELLSIGVNRLSIGAQSFCDEQLSMLGRSHKVSDIIGAIEIAKRVGFENIGIDLIFALPGTEIKSWRENLKKAIDCDVQHVSAYALSYEDGTIFERMRAAGELVAVNDALDEAMYAMTIEMLSSVEFGHYEISNFAKTGFQCRHNLVYWDDGDYLGIGPAAGSHVGDERSINVADIEKYIEAIDGGKSATGERQVVTEQEAVREAMVLGLRKIKGVEIEKFQKRMGIDVGLLFGQTISKYQNMGMIEIDGGFLRLTSKGLPIADSILCEFV